MGSQRSLWIRENREGLLEETLSDLELLELGAPFEATTPPDGNQRGRRCCLIAVLCITS